jgi:hypothetical protein
MGVPAGILRRLIARAGRTSIAPLQAIFARAVAGSDSELQTAQKVMALVKDPEGGFARGSNQLSRLHKLLLGTEMKKIHDVASLTNSAENVVSAGLKKNEIDDLLNLRSSLSMVKHFTEDSHEAALFQARKVIDQYMGGDSNAS